MPYRPESWMALREICTQDLEYIVNHPHLFHELTTERATEILKTRI